MKGNLLYRELLDTLTDALENKLGAQKAGIILDVFGEILGKYVTKHQLKNEIANIETKFTRKIESTKSNAIWAMVVYTLAILALIFTI